MNAPTVIVKCRHHLTRLTKQGIRTSRITNPSHHLRDIPEAFLVSEDGRAWIVAIWAGRRLLDSLLLDESDENDGAAAFERFAESLTTWIDRRRAIVGDPAPQLVILAPLLDESELSMARPQHFPHLPIFTRQCCRSQDTLGSAFDSLLGPVLTANTIDYWRSEVVPEVQITSPKAKRQIVRETASLVAPLLLDYRQEHCARLDLEPEPEVKKLSSEFRVRLVTGVAGCGKTLVLVHRAALLSSHFPNARVLLLSHNRPLIADLRRRLNRLRSGGQIHCLTFYQWLSRVSPISGEMMHPREIRQWIERENQRHPRPHLIRFSEEWIAEELAWMFDHDLVDERYLDAERKGRRIPLSKNQRREILSLSQHYRQYLSSNGRSDWTEWPLTVKESRSWAFQREQFDHILIDEAQFFAPIWFDLLRLALKSGGNLFLCADPTQGFLKRRFSWASLGLAVGNRSVRLERPYRNTRAILKFARDFYLARLPEDDEPLNLPSPEWMESLEPGVPPVIIGGGARQDQLASLVREIASLQEHRLPLSDVMILIAGREFSEMQIVELLNQKLGSETAALIKDLHADPESLGVAHLMASTGLERPIVYLLGIDDLAAEEMNPRLTEEERSEKVRDHTRQIYVGLTRAMERLVIYSENESMRQAMQASEHGPGDHSTAEHSG